MPHLVLAYTSPTTRKVVELSFTGEDIEVHAFGDAAQALEYTRAQPTDVLLADIALPDMDGYELGSRLRKNPQTARTPAVLLVGSSDSLDVERAQDCGYTGFLRKPFETSRLVDLVKDLLDRSSRVPPADARKDEIGDLPFHISAGREKGERIFPLTASQCGPGFRLLARQIQLASPRSVMDRLEKRSQEKESRSLPNPDSSPGDA